MDIKKKPTNIDKPFKILIFSVFGVTLPPLVAKTIEIVSGFNLSPTTWKLVWLVSVVSSIVLIGSLLYFLVSVVPIEKPIYKLFHFIAELFGKHKANESDNSGESENHVSTNSPKKETGESSQKAKAEPLDERHEMFQPYVNDDCTDLPSMPILDILDEAFKTNTQKKDVGMALYCAKSLKWITTFPPYRQMAAIFGEEIVGSSSNFSTYMQPIREIDNDYGKAERPFLAGVKDMKAKLRKVAGIK